MPFVRGSGSAQAVIPRADIRRITIDRHDSVQDGTLIGAAAGAGIGLAFVVHLGGWGLDAVSWKKVVLHQAP